MELQVYFHDEHCGRLLVDEQQRMTFQYLPEYIKRGAPALSVSMPLREPAFPDSQAFPFFENLLPEGNIRQRLASRLGTADNNFSRLLDETGGDVAGAISLYSAQYPKEQIPLAHQDIAPPQQDIAPPQQDKETPALSAEALGEILKQIERHPFLAHEDKRMRLSLAGAQNKLPVRIDEEDGIHLPGRNPSTHIIKPPSSRFPSLVENEYLCMRAASAADLKTPQVFIRGIITPGAPDLSDEKKDCYVVQRFDRVRHEDRIRRLHQEDICQVTGTVSALKYAQDQGPGFAELFDIVRRYTRPSALHQQELIRRILFNIMIGNQDAHAKNFALLHLDDRVVLAPAYDLVCTSIYEELDNHFAMPVGQALTIDALDSAALQQFQHDTGVNLKRQSKVLCRFLERASHALQKESHVVKEQTWPEHHPFIDKIVHLALGNARRLRDWLTG